MPTAGEKLPTYDVAAIKPARPEDRNASYSANADHLIVKNLPLLQIIRLAYDLKSESQLHGGPDWIAKQRFDIVAKFDEAEIAKINSMTPQERDREVKLATQSLLAERFQLRVTVGSATLPAYRLVVAGKSGATMTPHKAIVPTNANPNPVPPPRSIMSNGHIKANGISISNLVNNLSLYPEVGDRILFDRTGLPGDYDFELNWTSERRDQRPADPPYPNLFAALQEQLGLKLVPSNESAETINIDSAALPVFD